MKKIPVKNPLATHLPHLPQRVLTLADQKALLKVTTPLLIKESRLLAPRSRNSSRHYLMKIREGPSMTSPMKRIFNVFYPSYVG